MSAKFSSVGRHMYGGTGLGRKMKISLTPTATVLQVNSVACLTRSECAGSGSKFGASKTQGRLT